MRAIIVSGGTAPTEKLLKEYIKKEDFIIGADKGIESLYKYNIKPNLILGDFDSTNKEVLECFEDSEVEVLKYNTDKDYTDTHLAYIKAKERGFNEIVMFGVTGTRLDHAFGNIGLLLNALEDGIDLKIVDDNNIIFLVDKKTVIEVVEDKVLSFHAFSDVVEDFTVLGARYELSNYNLKLFEPRTICNEFIGKPVTIDFKKGKVLILLTND